MRRTARFMALGCLALASALSFAAAAIEYLPFRPLSQAVGEPVQDCRLRGSIPVPVIAWGGDIATSLANGNARETTADSPLGEAGLDLALYRQDDFVRQVEDYLTCKTPFLRGTVGMLSMAADVTERDPRTRMVVVYQMTWSAGGDALVVKPGIERPADLRGKTIAIQAYGPHVDYLTRILADAGLSVADVELRWLRDLIEIDVASNAPAKAFREDAAVDAAFVILPDALALTSGGAVGTGGEDSVKGAKILLSTKTANRVIADVYAVRSDYFEVNKAAIGRFVNALLKGEERLRQLVAARERDRAPFQRAFAAAAELLLDSAGAVEDTLAMYGDAEFVGYSGNVRFFTDKAYPRGFDKVTGEIQRAMVELGVLRQPQRLAQAGWDYGQLTAGITATAPVERERFDREAVSQLVERRQQQDVSQGELFRFEIYFGPNQNSFPADQYRDAFQQVVELASTYGGALLTVEGHSDPLSYLRQKKAGEAPAVLQRLRQASKNLSFTRANAVRDSIIAYARAEGVTLDPSQFGVLGLGVSRPNTPGCTYDGTGDIALSCAPASEAQWNATRRVVFRVIQVEAEADVFRPL